MFVPGGRTEAGAAPAACPVCFRAAVGGNRFKVRERKNRLAHACPRRSYPADRFKISRSWTRRPVRRMALR